MLTAITDEKKVKACMQQLARELKQYSTVQPSRTIAYPQGTYTTKVKYSSELGLWWCFSFAEEKNSVRYWNAFGIDNVLDHSKLRITAEINMPIKGTNLRVGGTWATDAAGHKYLLHNGKIGGGARGVGQSLFLNHFNFDALQEVDMQGRIRKYVIVTRLGSPTIGREVAYFIKEIHRIKELAKAINKKRLNSPSYLTEFIGIKKYALKDDVVVDSSHGLVVDALKKALQKSGFIAYNNLYIDLFTQNRNRVQHLFEIKTQFSRQWVYTAVGQLQLHSLASGDQPTLYFVCPIGITSSLRKDLLKINIHVITYRCKGNQFIFTNLDDHF